MSFISLVGVKLYDKNWVEEYSFPLLVIFWPFIFIVLLALLISKIFNSASDWIVNKLKR